MSQAPLDRPYRRAARVVLLVGAALVLASFPQLFWGVPLSTGFAPAGLSLGPLTLIAGIILYNSGTPDTNDRSADDVSHYQ